MLCALIYRQNGDSANLLKSARKKGVRCNRYLANAQIEVPLIGMGLPLPFDQSCEMSVLLLSVWSVHFATLLQMAASVLS